MAPANPVRCPQSARQPLARLASMISAKLRRGHALSAEHEFGAQASRAERAACAKKMHGTHVGCVGQHLRRRIHGALLAKDEGRSADHIYLASLLAGQQRGSLRRVAQPPPATSGARFDLDDLICWLCWSQHREAQGGAKPPSPAEPVTVDADLCFAVHGARTRLRRKVCHLPHAASGAPPQTTPRRATTHHNTPRHTKPTRTARHATKRIVIVVTRDKLALTSPSSEDSALAPQPSYAALTSCSPLQLCVSAQVYTRLHQGPSPSSSPSVHRP